MAAARRWPTACARSTSSASTPSTSSWSTSARRPRTPSSPGTDVARGAALLRGARPASTCCRSRPGRPSPRAPSTSTSTAATTSSSRASASSRCRSSCATTRSAAPSTAAARSSPSASARFAAEERAGGWHVQYDHYGDDSDYLHDRAQLTEWDGDAPAHPASSRARRASCCCSRPRAGATSAPARSPSKASAAGCHAAATARSARPRSPACSSTCSPPHRPAPTSRPPPPTSVSSSRPKLACPWRDADRRAPRRSPRGPRRRRLARSPSDQGHHDRDPRAHGPLPAGRAPRHRQGHHLHPGL